MHRKPLLNLLATYREAHPDEEPMAKRFIDFVESHDDCFERHLQIGHVTASAWVVNPDGTKTLLTHHKKLNKWLQLGGHADGDANVLNVATREVMEESGSSDFTPVTTDIFDIDIHLIPEHKGIPAHDHHDIRFCFRARTEAYIVSDESHDLAWAPITELENYSTEESILRMARKWKRRCAP